MMSGVAKTKSGRFFRDIADVIVQFLANITNGVFYEMRLKLDQKSQYEGFLAVKYQRFLEIVSQQPRTRAIGDFVSLIGDEEHWAEFENEQMDKYFKDQIELFPYRGGEKSGKLGLGFDKPDEYFRIQMEMIRRRFPGGDKDGEIGDADIRRLITCLRFVFRHNFKTLILQRRYAALRHLGLAVMGSAVLGLLAYGFNFLIKSNSAVLRWIPFVDTYTVFYVLSGTILAMFLGFSWWVLFFKFRSLSEHYSETVRHSCSVLGRALEMRIQNIIATIPLIFNEIEKSRFNYDNQAVREQWPQEVKKWSKLAFWMSARVEHLEFFLQAQMWRIRRIHFGFKTFAVVYSWSIAAMVSVFGILSVLVLAWLLVGTFTVVSPQTPEQFMAAVPLAFAAFAHFVSFIIAIGSYTQKTPDLDLIESTLQTEKMHRNHDVKLYDEVALFLYREKKALLNEEDKLSGKKG